MTPPDGKPTTLIAIKDWDYNWQETYFLKEPMAIKKGTKLAVEAVYDNSDKNPQQPVQPAAARVLGEQTTNEMCFVFLGATSDVPGASRSARRAASRTAAGRRRRRRIRDRGEPGASATGGAVQRLH